MLEAADRERAEQAKLEADRVSAQREAERNAQHIKNLGKA